jgi:Xaa-Pro aminopeptidase
LGTEGAKEKLGLKMAFNGEDFARVNIDFSKFDKVILDRLPADIVNSQRDKADLFDLVQQFKEKSAMPEQLADQKKFDIKLYRELTATLREIKTPEEMTLLRKAV